MDEQTFDPGIDASNDDGGFESFDWSSEDTSTDTGEVSDSGSEQTAQQIDPTAYQQTQQELENLRRWQQDALRNPHLLQGIAQHLPQQQQYLTPEQQAQMELQSFVQNPTGYKQSIKEELMSEIAMQAEGQALINEYRQKFPQLSQYERYIELEVQAAQQEAAMKGQRLGMRESLEAGIKRFQQSISGVQQQATGQGMQREAMRLDLNGSSPPPAQKPDISKMSREEFAAYREHIKQERYKNYYQ